MLSPKKTKYRKMHRGRLKGKACRNNKLQSGSYGIQAMEPTWISARQIEALRRTILRYTKKVGKLTIRIFPDKSITARAKESRMGAGKGAVIDWVAVVLPGVILFELGGEIPKEIALKALKHAMYKLPIKAKILDRDQNLS